MEGMEVVKAVLGAILRAVIAVAVVAVIYKGAMRGCGYEKRPLPAGCKQYSGPSSAASMYRQH